MQWWRTSTGQSSRPVNIALGFEKLMHRLFVCIHHNHHLAATYHKLQIPTLISSIPQVNYRQGSLFCSIPRLHRPLWLSRSEFESQWLKLPLTKVRYGETGRVITGRHVTIGHNAAITRLFLPDVINTLYCQLQQQAAQQTVIRQ